MLEGGLGALGGEPDGGGGGLAMVFDWVGGAAKGGEGAGGVGNDGVMSTLSTLESMRW